MTALELATFLESKRVRHEAPSLFAPLTAVCPAPWLAGDLALSSDTTGPEDDRGVAVLIPGIADLVGS